MKAVPINYLEPPFPLARALIGAAAAFLFILFCFFSLFRFKSAFALASSWRRLKGRSGASVRALQLRAQFIQGGEGFCVR